MIENFLKRGKRKAPYELNEKSTIEKIDIKEGNKLKNEEKLSDAETQAFDIFTDTKENITPKIKTYLNKNNCRVYVYQNYLSKQESHALLDHCLKKIQWIHHTITVFDKEVFQPRLTCGMGTKHCYSKSMHPQAPWTEEVLKVQEKINKDMNTKFNSCLLNRYRNGNEYIASHSDDKDHLSRNGIVAGISVGQERIIVLTEKKGDKKIKFLLPNGSLFVMEGDTQEHWRHGIPKEIKESR